MTPGEQKRILVIGDVPELMEILEDRCEHPVWTVETAPDAASALARTSEQHFDLVLSDHERSKGGEIEFLRALRAARPGLRVIVLSSRDMPEVVLPALQAHAYGYFSRPFVISAVQEMIRQALNGADWEDGIRIVSAAPDFVTVQLRCRMPTAERMLVFMEAMHVDLPSHERSAVGTAFRELLLNAIEHGGKLDPEKWVRVSRVRTARTLVYYIQDPGEGFRRKDLSHAAVNNVGNPTAHVEHREALGLRPGGFGMLVAREMIDEIIYNESGNEVILIKHLV